VKILLISPTFSGIGGIAQHVRGLSQYMKNTGNEVDVLSSDNSFTIPIKGLKNPSFMISSSLKTKFMKKHDIVHAHNIPSAHSKALVSYFLENFPVVLPCNISICSEKIP